MAIEQLNKNMSGSYFDSYSVGGTADIKFVPVMSLT